jgi:hypothetical protein
MVERRTKRRRTYFTLGEMISFGNYVITTVVRSREIDNDDVKFWKELQPKTTKDILKKIEK